jgi:hypothetical protein
MTEIRGRGRAAFAAVLLMIGGVLNIIYGIAAIGNSHFFVHNTHYVFGSLKTWGWIALILGIAQIVASMSLFAGNEFGRWFGIAFGSLAAIDALLSIPAYPLWSLALFALSIWIVYGLAIYEEPDRAAPAQATSADQPTRAPAGRAT